MSSSDKLCMSDAKKYKHSVDLDDFKYEEERTILDLNASDYDKLKNKLKSEKKNYVLKNNTGTKFIADDADDVVRILREENISEVLVNEVSTENAKLSRIKMNNSHFDIEKKNNAKSNLSLVENQTLPLALSFELSLNNDSNLTPLRNDERHAGREIEKSEKHSVFTSKKKIIRKSSSIYKNFFRMKNNSEVFKLGKGFLTDYSAGKKCFGFSAMGNTSNMVNTMYGVASFFNFYCHLGGLLFMNDAEFEEISKYIPFKSSMHYDDILEKDYCLWEAEGMSVITYSTFDSDSRGRVFDFIERQTLRGEVVLCSLPSSEVLLSEIELFFQVLQKMDNVSFVVKKNQSSLSDIKKSVSFLDNYKVKIKGIIFG